MTCSCSAHLQPHDPLPNVCPTPSSERLLREALLHIFDLTEDRPKIRAIVLAALVAARAA